MIGGGLCTAAGRLRRHKLCMCSTQSGYTALFWAARRGHADCVRVLLEGGADKEAKDEVRFIKRHLH